VSSIGNEVKENRSYRKKYARRSAQRPYPKVAVVTCMDQRLSDPPSMLGIPQDTGLLGEVEAPAQQSAA
jgi:carbonic anhydrase